ncbi:MAG: hypothetical protein QXY85_06870 [Candidatus Nitrosocaldus sp.]
MRRSILLFITSVISWLVIIYTNLFLAINAPKQNISNDYSLSSIPVGSRWVDEGYSDDGKDHSPWRLKVWKWREFLACESISLDIHDVNAYNYVRFDGSSIEMSLLTMPEMDYVYVAGISIGDVWGDGGNSNLYQLEPLKVAILDRLTLDLNIHEFRGAPLSPFILPSWYALLTDLWFRIKNVTIEDASGVKRYEEKVLGIDIFHRTMGGGLNILVMGMKDEYSRIEPCNKNFIYSINLPSSTTSIDILALLKDVQEEARSKGWYFNMDDVELVMVETVLESYWSYTYARVEPPVIVYSKRVD